jgi:hypothetical protein
VSFAAGVGLLVDVVACLDLVALAAGLGVTETATDGDGLLGLDEELISLQAPFITAKVPESKRIAARLQEGMDVLIAHERSIF